MLLKEHLKAIITKLREDKEVRDELHRLLCEMHIVECVHALFPQSKDDFSTWCSNCGVLLARRGY